MKGAIAMSDKNVITLSIDETVVVILEKAAAEHQCSIEQCIKYLLGPLIRKGVSWRNTLQQSEYKLDESKIQTEITISLDADEYEELEVFSQLSGSSSMSEAFARFVIFRSKHCSSLIREIYKEEMMI